MTKPVERQRIERKFILRGDLPQKTEINRIPHRLGELHQIGRRWGLKTQHHGGRLDPDTTPGRKFNLQIRTGIRQDVTGLVAAVFFEQNVHGGLSQRVGDLTSGHFRFAVTVPGYSSTAIKEGTRWPWM